MPSYTPPVFDAPAIRANPARFDRWEADWHDFALLAGFRDPAKDRDTEGGEHYKPDQRPLELAALRHSLPLAERSAKSSYPSSSRRSSRTPGAGCEG